MPILPDQFDSTPVLDLLLECEKGLIGFDQRLIASLLARRADTLAALAVFTADEREDALLDMREQAFDLYRHLRAPEALPFYIDLLKQRGETIPDELVEAFSDLGAAAVDPLLALHQDSVDDDRPDLVFLLSTLGVDDPRISALIVASIKTDPYEGAICAGLSADPALKPAVLAALEKTAAGSEEHKILGECLEQIEAGRPPHELSGYDITADYPEKALPLFDQMDPAAALAFFDCEEREYRARAAMGFTDDDYPDEIRDRLVALAKNDTDSLVRGAALRALGERIAEPDVRALLINALETRQDQHDEWMGALIGLAGATSEPEVHTALLEAYAREDSRAGALQTMWRSLDARYKKYFGPNLKHADPDIRRQAVQGVGAFPITELAFDLVALFKDDELRDEALFSYAMAVDHQTTPKTVNKLFDRIAEKAGGLDDEEEDTVATALDRRLEREGFEAVYFPDEDHDHPHEAEPPQEPVRVDKVGRNDPCPCGSGKKYKKCCGAA